MTDTYKMFTTALKARVDEFVAAKELQPKKLTQQANDLILLIKFCQSELRKFPQGK